MSILLIEFVDCENDPEEIEGWWKITDDCLRFHETENEKTREVIIPMHNIFRMTEYEE